MARLCEERVVIVTGAGRGIGREHALALAAAGARVVVNDIGTALNGEGASQTPAEEVVAEIVAAGGQAIANADDIAEWAGSERLVQQAISSFGRLDAVVNNAGFVRDRMFVSATEEEWDAVVRVHMKGHFCVARHAAAHWRDAAKAGAKTSGRIINTSSGAGIWGSVGQAAYSAAKAGIAALTMVQSAELGRYGATSNAISPMQAPGRSVPRKAPPPVTRSSPLWRRKKASPSPPSTITDSPCSTSRTSTRPATSPSSRTVSEAKRGWS